MATTAEAHPNIALVKYWGKQDKPGNLPATPNLSVTLDTLTTRTRIDWDERDTFVLNGEAISDAKLEAFLKTVRTRFDIGPLRIESSNNFPTGAGLASSASGYAALVMALNTHADLGLNTEFMSEIARLGSASAARSLYGGFAVLVPPLWRANSAGTKTHWPLRIVVAVTSTAPKSVSSTQGMERSRRTSPYYDAWLRSSSEDFARAADAVAARDFSALSDCAELNCLKMHSLMLTSKPTLNYWNAATLACMEIVQNLRAEGVPVFFTIDAGPQVKAVCLPEAEDAVATALQDAPGVLDTIRCGLGDGARIV